MIRYLYLALLALVLVVALAANVARAAVQLDEWGCVAYGAWSRDLIWAREVGADRERVRASLTEMRDEGGGAAALFILLLRDLDALWSTTMPREAVLELVIRECAARGGSYGDES